MHLTTTKPVSGVWRQKTRAGVIPAISFTRLSRRNARISAHAMRKRAYASIFAHAMRCDAMRMRAYDAMRMRASRGNLCVSGTVCANASISMLGYANARNNGMSYTCLVLYVNHVSKRRPGNKMVSIFGFLCACHIINDVTTCALFMLCSGNKH